VYSTETELELELEWSFAAVESWAVVDSDSVVGSGNFFGDSDNAVHLNVTRHRVSLTSVISRVLTAMSTLTLAMR
jgi:hypothetical protein